MNAPSDKRVQTRTVISNTSIKVTGSFKWCHLNGSVYVCSKSSAKINAKYEESTYVVLRFTSVKFTAKFKVFFPHRHIVARQ